jgi:hypothetical protein
MAVGVKKIRPLTNLKILSAGGIFILWTLNIATEDYMMYNAGLVVLPSLVEVIFEVRNFLKQRRRLRMASQASGAGMAMGALGITGGNHFSVADEHDA